MQAIRSGQRSLGAPFRALLRGGYLAVLDQELGTASIRSFASEPYSYDPPGRHHLFVPGPVNIHDNTQRAMLRPASNHRDPWFPSFYKQLLEDVKFIFGTTKATSIIFPGTGTGGWESALSNTLSPGDKVVAFRFGQFSHLWIDMMERLGLDVIKVEVPWGEGVPEDKLAEILKQDTEKKIKAVTVVHNETTTGVTSDVGKVRETIDSSSHPALLLVDGVSSIGALNFEFDKWGVDVAVTGSQKALSLPTGLAVLAISDKALAARSSATLPRVYYDWDDQLKTNESGNTQYTPINQTLYGLRASLDLLLAEGWENVVKRHHRLAEGTRKAVAAWGLQLLCANPRWNSDSLTVVKVPEGVDSNRVVKEAFARYNLSIGVGLSEVNGKVFRIGHLGNMDEVMLLSALAGTEMALINCGVKITPGSGVGAAIKYFAETSEVIKTRTPAS